MDSDNRIEQLEQQVRQLTALVQQLSAGQAPKEDAAPAAPAAPTPETAPATAPPTRPRRKPAPLPRKVSKEDVRRKMDQVLGGEQGESLETRIGGIWLSRIAMVLLMTMVVLGARVTMYSEVLGPAQKLAITFAASAIAVAYGAVWWRSRTLFPETVLGAGLAGLYFSIYAAFFVDGMQIMADKSLAAPMLAGGLAVMLAVLHMRRSQAAAGLALFLVYYTVVASATSGGSVENLLYALVCSAALAAAAVLFHVLHRWLLFSWAALVATYATYFYYFLSRPASLAISELDFFWLSNGFLALCYIVFSLGCIADARKTGEFRRTVGPMIGFNSAVFFTFTWFAIREHYLSQEWLFRIGFTGLLLSFAIAAELAGPRRNYLTQIYLAKTVVMFTLALQAYMSGDKLMVAMALECLGLAFSYKRSGVVMFKVLGILMLFVVFIGCLFHVKTPGSTELFSLVLPSNWLCCAGSAGVLLLISWFYERFVRRVRPEHRIVKGQWFLADSPLDLRSPTAALVYAAAAALILLTITIIDLGSDPLLPFILAAEGVLVGLTGVLMGAAQVEIAGVLLIVACHVCFYIFLALGIPGFEQQTLYTPYTIGVALFTYIGAYLWERYLTRVRGGRAWEHHTAAALPYLAATVMLSTLIVRKLSGMETVLAQQGLGLIVLFVGAITAYPGVKASGLLALLIGAALFCRNLYLNETALLATPRFLFYFFLLSMGYVAAERLFVVLQHQERAPSRLEDTVRVALIALGSGLGVVVFWRYSGPQTLTLYWVVLAVMAVALGALFGESRYRWAAIALFLLAIARAFRYDLGSLPPTYSFISFAVLTGASLTVAWAYSRYRQRLLKPVEPHASPDQPAQ